MITPAEIKAKAGRKYRSFLESRIRGDEFFPLDIRFGKVQPSDDYLEAQKWVQQLRAEAKESKGFGYAVKFDNWNSRRYGEQSVPERIWFEGAEDYLRYLGKTDEVRCFQQAAGKIREQFPALEEWMAQAPQKVIKYLGTWPVLLEVCQFFVRNPRSGYHMRQIPISADTKFIENHKGILKELLDLLLPQDAIQADKDGFEQRYYLQKNEPLLRFRILDQQLQEQIGLPVNDLAVPYSDAVKLSLQGTRCIITENKANFLDLPELPQTFGIWGKGYSVNILKELNWLKNCTLIYWGDLDAHGFEILSHLKKYFPKVRSVLMDSKTLGRFDKDSFVEGEPINKSSLPNVSKKEQAVFAYLQDHNLRLEQDRLRTELPYVAKQLQEALAEG